MWLLVLLGAMISNTIMLLLLCPFITILMKRIANLILGMTGQEECVENLLELGKMMAALRSSRGTLLETGELCREVVGIWDDDGCFAK